MLIAESVSEFSGLRSFLLFEDLCNREGSLEANKTRKRASEFKLKQEGDKETSKLQPISLISYLLKKEKLQYICKTSLLLLYANI